MPEIFLCLSLVFFLLGVVLSSVYLIRTSRRRKYMEEMYSRIKKETEDSIRLLSQLKQRYPEYVFLTVYNKVVYISRKIQSLKNIRDRVYYYEQLYKMIYETKTRLQANFYDVGSITAPLNNLNSTLEGLNDYA